MLIAPVLSRGLGVSKLKVAVLCHFVSLLGAKTSKGEISELWMCCLLWRHRARKGKDLHAGSIQRLLWRQGAQKRKDLHAGSILRLAEKQPAGG